MSPSEIVRALRYEWWVNHGCDFAALYGDDGEMQCGQCFHDFKREPLDTLNVAVSRMRMARAAALSVTGPKSNLEKEAADVHVQELSSRQDRHPPLGEAPGPKSDGPEVGV